VVRGGPGSLLDFFRPLRLAGSAPPPSKEPREVSRSFSPPGPGGGDVEVRDRGGSESGDQWMTVPLSNGGIGPLVWEAWAEPAGR
jgi:hypothetical protein